MGRKGRVKVKGQQGIPVSIDFETLIKDPHGRDKISFQANGLYYKKDDISYLLFDENHEDRKVKATMKIGKGEVTIIRNGGVMMRHQYRVNETTEGTFSNELGVFQTKAYTKKLQFLVSEGPLKGVLQLGYKLFVGDENAGSYNITVSIKEATI
ncbi:hypothetical protein COJ46_08260 [Bacillus sp. AFS077874]|nr:hypothetical protein CON00_05650 [Bacillus sp. AFS096315]PFM82052.1 hypothetical protein COJ46_08260 [Bacillus sp. AFS077874]